MVKCGLCGAEVKEQPRITADGKCSVCGARLAAASPSGKLGVVAGQKKK